jgi:hypothetical protein
MSRIVQKYGGTSVGDVERIKKVAARIKGYREDGHQVVVVVSARSGVTNELIARAKAVCDNPDEREMDQLLAIGEQETIALTAMALHGLGVPAISYTGAQAGIVTLTAFISPYRRDRDAVRAMLAPGDFVEIHVRAPLEVCESRDPKGLYKKARAGEIKGFTGIDDPYEEPLAAELVVDSAATPAEQLADQVIAWLEQAGKIPRR